ncbi:MAG: rubrerythrin family protein [Endomicrobium sp.]|jgi:rubrerythrin|nr:rubrerythrin family protein [Endomicrobium sp.]
MNKSIKGTETEKNLLKAFCGEAQANLRYNFFASAAKKEGLEQIAAIFEETANNEKEHAKRFYSFLENNNLNINTTFSSMPIYDTMRNLKFAISGENKEHSQIYPLMSKIAKDEGFCDVSECFNYIAVVERHHEIRYLMLFDNLENDRTFKKDIVTRWKCRNCGYIYESKEALEICPACLHSKAYAEELCDNF